MNEVRTLPDTEPQRDAALFAQSHILAADFGREFQSQTAKVAVPHPDVAKSHLTNGSEYGLLGYTPCPNPKEGPMTSAQTESPEQSTTAVPARQQSTYPVPTSIEEAYRIYDGHVRHQIKRLVPQSLGDNEDDLSSKIWLDFVTGQPDPLTGQMRSYLEIFDPRMGSFSTFIFEFARVRCMQFLSRTERTPTAKAYSIQSQPDDQFVIGVVDPETSSDISLHMDEYTVIEFSDLEKRATLAIHRAKQRGKRDLRWVWHLLRHGYRQDQIAEEMGLSEGTISICMDLIRDFPEVKELRAWAAEHGILSHRSSLG
jgi:DNA-directed RNA polymerase specialized sigma24 family protein